MQGEGAPEVRWGWRHAWSVLGLVALLMWLPFYALISLIAPAWVVVPAMVVWAGFLYLVVRWFKAYPLRVLAVGVGAVVLWHLAGFVFESLLGWTA